MVRFLAACIVPLLAPVSVISGEVSVSMLFAFSPRNAATSENAISFLNSGWRVNCD